MLFVLLVGLNLTLVCQGHSDAHHHAGQHLTVLGEPPDPSEPGDNGVAATVSAYPQREQIQSPLSTTAWSLFPSWEAPTADNAIRAYTGSADAPDVSTLTLFVGEGATVATGLRAFVLGVQSGGKSQTVPTPEPPPPQELAGGCASVRSLDVFRRVTILFTNSIITKEILFS